MKAFDDLVDLFPTGSGGLLDLAPTGRAADVTVAGVGDGQRAEERFGDAPLVLAHAVEGLVGVLGESLVEGACRFVVCTVKRTLSIILGIVPGAQQGVLDHR